REQNTQVAAGQIGQWQIRNPDRSNVGFPAELTGPAQQITITTLGRLNDVKQFEEIVVKTMRDGRIVRLKDVARVELGAKNQDVLCRLDRKPSVSMSI